MESEELILSSLLNVKDLMEHDMKYLMLEEEDSTTVRAFKALLELVKEKRRPVRIKEIAMRLYGENVTKSKEDSVRIILERSYVKKGIVRKLLSEARTAYYIPSAYRFRIVGRRSEKIVEIPRKYWPFPKEALMLYVEKKTIERILEKIEEDYSSGKISRETYDRAIKYYEAKLKKLLNGDSKVLKLVELIELATANASTKHR